MSRVKGAMLATAAAAAVLVPLYGGPGQGPVKHPEWAEMVLRALELEPVLDADGTPLVFESLSWRTSVGLAPDRPFRSVGAEFLAGPPIQVRASGAAPAELGYRLAVPRPGDYRVRLKLGLDGSAAPSVAVELTAKGETAPKKSLALACAPLVDSGGIYLSPAVYTLSVGIPPGPTLESIEVVPPCLNAIQPPGGWRAEAIAQTGEVAVTVLKAIDLESELPAAAPDIEIPGEAFRPASAQALTARMLGQRDGFWLRAGPGGLGAVAQVSLPEAGLYTVYGLGVLGGGQSWVIDACHKSVLCPSSEAPEAPQWRPLLTTEFSVGRHAFAVTLAEGATVERLKLERKTDTVDDYLATVRRLGLDLGEPREIPRPLAVEAMEFIRKRRRLTVSKCEDIVLKAEVALAGLALPGATRTPTAGPGFGPDQPPVVPLSGPTPSPAATPAPEPSGSPSPAASPSPAPSPTPGPTSSPTPSPTLPPPPTTTTQPPASPVKD